MRGSPPTAYPAGISRSFEPSSGQYFHPDQVLRHSGHISFRRGSSIEGEAFVLRISSSTSCLPRVYSLPTARAIILMTRTRTMNSSRTMRKTRMLNSTVPTSPKRPAKGNNYSPRRRFVGIVPTPPQRQAFPDILNLQRGEHFRPPPPRRYMTPLRSATRGRHGAEGGRV